MSRIIKTESNVNDRNRLSRWIVFAIRELMAQPEPNSLSKDLVAFIVLCLEEINQSVEASVIAWEKRDYWVKADRFRMQWKWAGRYARDLLSSLDQEDWGEVAILVAQLGQRFLNVKVPTTIKTQPPWKNAYMHLKGDQA